MKNVVNLKPITDPDVVYFKCLMVFLYYIFFPSSGVSCGSLYSVLVGKQNFIGMECA